MRNGAYKSSDSEQRFTFSSHLHSKMDRKVLLLLCIALLSLVETTDADFLRRSWYRRRRRIDWTRRRRRFKWSEKK